MSWIFNFALRTAANTGVLWVASSWIPRFHVAGQAFPGLAALGIPPYVESLIVGGAILALLNTFVRPVLKFLGFPLIILTLGLFHLVINIIILGLADWLFAALTIEGWMALILGSLFIGVANTLTK